MLIDTSNSYTDHGADGGYLWSPGSPSQRNIVHRADLLEGGGGAWPGKHILIDAEIRSSGLPRRDSSTRSLALEAA